MKILIVHNFYQQAGGEDAVVASEIDLLRKHGHDVSLFSAHNNKIASRWKRLVSALGVVYNLKSRSTLKRRLETFKPDIVHVHNFFPMLSPSIFDASRAVKIPSVLTLHNFRTICPTGVLYHNGQIVERSLTRSAWWAVPQRVYHDSLLGTLAVTIMIEFHRRMGTWRRKVDCFIALTPFAKQKFIAASVPEHLLEVKGNAASAPERSLIINAASRYGALYVGRLSAEKGPQVLMAAWQEIQYPVRICGTGPLDSEMRAPANPAVEFLGHMGPSQVRSEMLQASFLVMPSVCYEMFPMTLAEAFGCGLPVIVSGFGALADLVQDGMMGLHFAPGDSEDLRRKVKWAIENPEDMRQMGQNARAEYERKFTPEANYQNLLRIYESTLQKFRNAQARG